MQMNINSFYHLNEMMSSKSAATAYTKCVFAVVVCVCTCTLLYFGIGILECETCSYHENSRKWK